MKIPERMSAKQYKEYISKGVIDPSGNRIKSGNLIPEYEKMIEKSIETPKKAPEKTEGGTYIINVNPMGKPRQTQSDRWKKRPVVVRYRDLADEMRRQADILNLPKLTGEINVLKFEIAMPKSWSKEERADERNSSHL